MIAKKGRLLEKSEAVQQVYDYMSLDGEQWRSAASWPS